jgi:hypothetical protein
MTNHQLGEFVRFIYSRGKRTNFRRGWIISIKRRLVEFSRTSTTFTILDTNGNRSERTPADIDASLDSKQVFTMRSADSQWFLYHRDDPPEEYIGPYPNPVEAIDDMAGMIRSMEE